MKEPDLVDNLSNNKKIAKNSIYMSIRMVILLCVTLYTTRAILQILGIEDYGIYNIICGFVSMFGFLNISMANGIQRFYNFELGKNGEDGTNKIYNTALIIQLLLSIIVIIIVECVGMWYIHNKMVIPQGRMNAAEWIFQCSLLSFLFVIMQVPYVAVIMAHERMDFYALVSGCGAFLTLLLVFIIPYIGGDQLIVYGVLLVSINIISFLLYYMYSKKNFAEIKFKPIIHKKLFISMLSFSGWNLLGSMSGIMKEQGVNLILNLFFGPVVNAAKGVATQVSSGLQSFVQNISTPVRPQVIQSYAIGNIQRTMRLTYSISKLSCMFLYMISVSIMFEINSVLHIWLGDNIPTHAASFCIIVIWTNFINNLNSAIAGVVHASGKMKTYQISGAIINFLALPFTYMVLSLGFSPEWALLLVLMVTILNQIVCLLVMKTIVSYSLHEYVYKIIFPFFLVVVITLWIPYLIVLFMDEGFIRLCLNFIISVVGIAVAIWTVGLEKKEKLLFCQIFGELSKRLKCKKITAMNICKLKLVLLGIKVVIQLIIARICVIGQTKQRLWLISERGYEARDNGFHFFEFVKTKYPNIQTCYVISSKSKDYIKLLKYRESLVEYNSFEHFKLICRASHLISTHIGGYLPYIGILAPLDRKFNILYDKKKIFLQHGIIKDYLPCLFGNYIKIDLFCCGAKLEYDYILRNFKHPNGVIKYTGLCRYDQLYNCKKQKQILIMPTWRMYINKDKFEESEYYMRYKELLTDNVFQLLLKKEGYMAILYLHYEFQSKSEIFKRINLPENIKVADFDYDIQDLLKESALLITDYSSVYFDMIYMHKPVIMYQFDHDIFRSRHYQQGYLDEQSLGDVVFNKEDLIKILRKILLRNCIIHPKYDAYGNSLFKLRDSNNCDRVYKAISSL